MKILFYNHTSQVSGAERVLLLILARLNRSRFEAVLVCPSAGQLQKEAKALDILCADVEQLNARFTWRIDALIRYFASFGSTIRRVRARVREHQPDVIHANSVRAGLVISAATIGLRIPIVWHIHDLLPKHPLSTCIRLFTLLRPPRRIVVVANAAAERFKGKLLRRFPQRVKVAVVYNAIEVTPRPPSTNVSIRKELRIRSSDRLIGIVGNLSPVKGQLELIWAFAETRKRIPNLTLLIVGSALFNRSDGYQKLLAAEVRILGLDPYVRFLGQRNDVAAIMGALDLLVMNSRSEAFPLVALEGMAVGVPVLATEVGGLPELITHETNGWLVPFGDEEKLVDGIASLLEQPQLSTRLATQGRQYVTKTFPVHEFMTRIEAMYTETAEKLARAVREQLVPLSSETS
ncbi:MAG TPA: glycosyltransferase family 4 protein [Pyrinomonadaceae bacterium]|nr:glycosyltransferase family 4 protein [Pyrinomonadaceae bacterium]